MMLPRRFHSLPWLMSPVMPTAASVGRGMALCLGIGGIGMGMAAIAPVPGMAAEGDGSETPTERRFTCQLDEGRYTVMYNPASQPDEFYPWAVPEDMGEAWPAQRRCTTISDRLESYRPDGLLELQTGVENGYNTVCVTTEAVDSCRIVFTVPQGQDPVATRDNVFDNLVLADQGERTEGVTTLTGNGSGNDILDQLGNVLGTGGLGSESSNGINLRPFLDAADGGTGTQLRGGGNSPGRRLNPDGFR